RTVARSHRVLPGTPEAGRGGLGMGGAAAGIVVSVLSDPPVAAHRPLRPRTSAAAGGACGLTSRRSRADDATNGRTGRFRLADGAAGDSHHRRGPGAAAGGARAAGAGGGAAAGGGARRRSRLPAV